MPEALFLNNPPGRGRVLCVFYLCIYVCTLFHFFIKSDNHLHQLTPHSLVEVSERLVDFKDIFLCGLSRVCCCFFNSSFDIFLLMWPTCCSSTLSEECLHSCASDGFLVTGLTSALI